MKARTNTAWLATNDMSDEELVLELRRVRNTLRGNDRIEYSTTTLKLRERECAAELYARTRQAKGAAR